MGIVVASTVGLIVWIVLWSLGAKAFDGFMITTVIVLLAATVKMLIPFLPGNAGKSPS
ncbi:hypothetical protein NBH00_13835 [Paraconexibacter antarcticus]|uniref:Uncharacterized protein n=1 Tax=Paraconexibacter antarcticus TaxID=2949664 RepID=A0ABY5DNQ3_9ACTN|nr:hypothetical protein [Paraconexibacter antarcticus]UTI62442.1 hypothetical protein NBH00_13835 [Paraconexibacter antarcticus]